MKKKAQSTTQVAVVAVSPVYRNLSVFYVNALYAIILYLHRTQSTNKESNPHEKGGSAQNRPAGMRQKTRKKKGEMLEVTKR